MKERKKESLQKKGKTGQRKYECKKISGKNKNNKKTNKIHEDMNVEGK